MGTLILAYILVRMRLSLGEIFFFFFYTDQRHRYLRSPSPFHWPQLTAGTNSLARSTQGSLFGGPGLGTDISDTDCLSYSQSVPEHSFTTVANTNLQSPVPYHNGLLAQYNVASNRYLRSPYTSQRDTEIQEFFDDDAADSLDEFRIGSMDGMKNSVSAAQSQAYSIDTTASLNEYGMSGLVRTNDFASATQSQAFYLPSNDFLPFSANDYVNPQHLAVQGAPPLVLDLNANLIALPSNQAIPPLLAPIVNTNVVAVQQRIACSYTPCPKAFARDSDRRRHENTVHGGQKYFCPIIGCPKTGATSYFHGYTRSDKLSEHL
jgi:hypothetical protein